MTSLSKLLCLALVAFAIGTESYSLAGLLPMVSHELSVPEARGSSDFAAGK